MIFWHQFLTWLGTVHEEMRKNNAASKLTWFWWGPRPGSVLATSQWAAFCVLLLRAKCSSGRKKTKRTFTSQKKKSQSNAALEGIPAADCGNVCGENLFAWLLAHFLLCLNLCYLFCGVGHQNPNITFKQTKAQIFSVRIMHWSKQIQCVDPV